MDGILSLILILFLAILMPGTINRTRAWMAGRRGVRFFQHLYNIDTLLHKGAVYSTCTGFLFQIAPAVSLGATFTALLLLPFGTHGALLSFDGDVILFAYLLALGRAFLILAALETGSSFEGMGSSREALYGAFAEPALLLMAGTLGLLTGQTSFSQIFASADSLSPQMTIVMLLILYLTIKLIIVETGRIPVDDPRTHLELTMIHEVMILDYSGIDLALLHITEWFKGAAIATLSANALASVFAFNPLTVLLLALIQAVVIGIVESFQARNKLARNTTYILTITALSFVVFMLAYVLKLHISIG